jgi:hypothetical protein
MIQEIDYEKLIGYIKDDNNTNIINATSKIAEYIRVHYKHSVQYDFNMLNDILKIVCVLDPELYKLLSNRWESLDFNT